MVKTRAEELAVEQREISVAAFFEKNRHLLGFDNPLRALSTTVKEVVDNSLDACEEMKVLPEVKVEIKQANETRFIISVQDNGPGIVKEQIPKVFAKLLYGSKFFKYRMSRGQQGIGVSASVLYGQLTTGKPAKIISKIGKGKPAHYYELRIDIHKNEPEIVKDDVVEFELDHGTKVEIELEGKYQKGRQSVDEYLKQTAISNPHLHLVYINPLKEKIDFPRALDQLPKEPKAIKPHPYGIEIGVLLRMLKGTKAKNVLSFLEKEFSRVSNNIAKEVCLKAKVDMKIKPQEINHEQAEALINAIKNAKISSPPLNCLSPIGEEALLRGLKKEIKADFYGAVTRRPSVYRGFPFQIECCTGDSKLCLEDGSIITIREYVENRMIDKKVFSMDTKLKVVPSKVLMVHKFRNEHRIFKITTRTGRSLKLTENNEVPIIDGGHIVWKQVNDVMAGEFVAVPRNINIYGRIPTILSLLNPDEVRIVNSSLVTVLMENLKKKYGTYKSSAENLGIRYEHFKAYKRTKKSINRPSLSILKKMINDLGLNFNDIEEKVGSIRVVDTKFTNPHTIHLPEINEDLLYILGLLNSDGYISRKGIIFVNLDESLHKSYTEKIKNLFGLTVKRYKKNESYLCNKTLYLILREIEKILPSLPDNLLISWIKGIVDGDGWVSVSKGRIKDIGVATAIMEKAEFLQTMFLRLGILSKIELKKIPKTFGKIGEREIKTKKIKYDLVIKNIDNIRKFYSLISFRQTKRANIFSKYIKKEIDTLQKGDVIPLGKTLYEFRKENDLFQYELGFSDFSVRQIENNNRNITRINLQQLISQKEFFGDTIKLLKLLAFSDILWDKIVNIELMPNEEYVYDLTVETGNFVANNIVMHNCAVAYGGELSNTSEELVRVIRFANKVPLQYQQSACAITRSVVNTVWRNYGLSQSRGAIPSGPAVILVHIASVWVPFTSEAKEAIAHYPEIIKEIKLALQEVGRKVGGFIRKTVKAREQAERANLFEKYIPELSSALSNLTDEKKNKIEEGLNKILKKSMKDILAGVDKEIVEEVNNKNHIESNVIGKKEKQARSFSLNPLEKRSRKTNDKTSGKKEKQTKLK